MFYGNPNFVIVFTTYFDLDDSFFFTSPRFILPPLAVYHVAMFTVLLKFYTNFTPLSCILLALKYVGVDLSLNL